jgi:hypothetical protein
MSLKSIALEEVGGDTKAEIDLADIAKLIFLWTTNEIPDPKEKQTHKSSRAFHKIIRPWRNRTP